MNNNVPADMFQNYLDYLINQFYKVLPMKECNNITLNTFLCSLQVELVGSIKLIEILENDAQYLSLLNITQYLIDNEYDTKTCKREIFKCIDIIEKLKNKYSLKKKECE